MLFDAKPHSLFTRASPQALIFPLGGRLQSNLRLHERTEAFGASRIDTEWQGPGLRCSLVFATTVHHHHGHWHWVTDPCGMVQRSCLGVKTAHAETEFLLFLLIIQHWKKRPYYSKFYSRVIGAGLSWGEAEQVLEKQSTCRWPHMLTCSYFIQLLWLHRDEFHTQTVSYIAYRWVPAVYERSSW